MPLVSDTGVQFSPAGESPWFVPWIIPHVLDPRQIGWVLTEWDVRWFGVHGRWPDWDHMAVSATSVKSRVGYDKTVRATRARGRGRRLSIPLDRVVRTRNLYYAGGRTTAEIAAETGEHPKTVQQIVRGRTYWWCGGGSKGWPGFNWRSA